MGFALLLRQVKVVFGYAPESVPEINAWADVPFADVVRAVDLFRRAGFEMRDGEPQTAPGLIGAFEPLATGLPRLTELLRELKSQDREVTASIKIGPDVPWAVAVRSSAGSPRFHERAVDVLEVALR